VTKYIREVFVCPQMFLTLDKPPSSLTADVIYGRLLIHHSQTIKLECFSQRELRQNALKPGKKF